MGKAKRGGFDRFILAAASAGGAGYFPRAPGTAGSAVGVLVFLLYSHFPPWLYLLSTAAFFALACWVAEKARPLWGEVDSPRIVIDEVTGYLAAMALVPCTASAICFGFLFFRLFDIIKPPPAGAIDRRMKNGTGVVLDDLVAGIYTNILLHFILFWRPEFLFLLDRFSRAG